MRNKRDVAHRADRIDPNQQDATMVVRNMEWVLAELLRLYHNVSAQAAHEITVDLVSKDVPLIQVFDGYPRVLKQLKGLTTYSSCSTGAAPSMRATTSCTHGRGLQRGRT